MPRKLKHPKARLDLPLTPAWRWLLMTGDFCTQRLDGWVQQAHDAERCAGGFDYSPHGDALWRVHGEALTGEAQAAGFEPYWATGRTPTGARVTAWRQAFLAAHTNQTYAQAIARVVADDEAR